MKSPRSLPAENAPGTPAIRTQRIGDAPPAVSIASPIASYIAEVSAFFLSGRFIRMVRIGPSSVTITLSVMRILFGGLARDYRVVDGELHQRIRKHGANDVGLTVVAGLVEDLPHLGLGGVEADPDPVGIVRHGLPGDDRGHKPRFGRRKSEHLRNCGFGRDGA